MGEITITAQEVGDRVLAVLLGELKEQWIALKEEHKEDLRWAAKEMGRLAVRKLRGEDVALDIEGLEAVIANLSYVGASEVRRGFWEAVNRTVGISGQLLAGLATGALGRL